MFDIAGVLILVLLSAVFIFLTARALKARQRWLKWAGTLLSGLLALIFSGLLVLALIGFGKLNAHFDNPVAEVQVERSAAQIARGEQLAHLCQSCHSPNNQLPLAGTNFVERFGFPPVGTLYAPNLTPSGDISDWTDGELIRAIREGVHKNGRSLVVMPSMNYRQMSDADVQALVAYLRTQPAAGGPSPVNHLNVLGALFTNLSDLRTVQQPVSQVQAPPAGSPEYGRYLVDILECRGCHGAELQGKLETGEPGPPPGPNLTRIVTQWSEADFMTYFNTGTQPNGAKVPVLTLPSGFSSPRMPWTMVRAATSDEDLKAIYTYIHNLPVVEGPVK